MKLSFLAIALSFAFVLACDHSLFAQPTTNSKDFVMPGQYKFVVPKGISTINVSLWGSGGWGGGQSGTLSGKGGKGGFVSGTITVKEGETILIIVGSNGIPGKSGSITAIKRDSIMVALAAAGGNGSSHGGAGGNGGITGSAGSTGGGNFRTGNSGTGASTTAAGTGGSAGSSGVKGKNGISLAGGTNDAKAIGEGWGGAGWFGGGAAATYSSAFITGDPFASGGGGGGSNYTKGLSGNITTNSNGNIGGTGNNSGIYGKVSLSW